MGQASVLPSAPPSLSLLSSLILFLSLSFFFFFHAQRATLISAIFSPPAIHLSKSESRQTFVVWGEEGGEGIEEVTVLWPKHTHTHSLPAHTVNGDR